MRSAFIRIHRRPISLVRISPKPLKKIIWPPMNADVLQYITLHSLWKLEIIDFPIHIVCTGRTMPLFARPVDSIL
jgi:hypothetical protein